jgi:hypothetical protein
MLLEVDCPAAPEDHEVASGLAEEAHVELAACHRCG